MLLLGKVVPFHPETSSSVTSVRDQFKKYFWLARQTGETSCTSMQHQRPAHQETAGRVASSRSADRITSPLKCNTASLSRQSPTRKRPSQDLLLLPPTPATVASPSESQTPALFPVVVGVQIPAPPTQLEPARTVRRQHPSNPAPTTGPAQPGPLETRRWSLGPRRGRASVVAARHWQPIDLQRAVGWRVPVLRSRRRRGIWDDVLQAYNSPPLRWGG